MSFYLAKDRPARRILAKKAIPGKIVNDRRSMCR